MSITNIKNILLVSSGKGGVGKSMVAVNTAYALSQNGYKTGILDADFYGPSVPLAMGIRDQRLTSKKEGGKELFYPIIKHGIKVNSLGFMMNPEDPVIWRGPLASSALNQLLHDTIWEELDFLVLDMPPGTGDIAISIVQQLPNANAIVVTTPQEMAVADARKAANMFLSQGMDIKVLGVVENMSWFTPQEHPEEKYFLFGKGGGAQLAHEISTSLLAQIPLVAEVGTCADQGKPIYATDQKPILDAFDQLIEKILDETLVTVA
ncbi:Mrp/NBP35 family ATP-binding protein [Halosquirtibacter xylanolyticus]|uniref:Mrp/NBP35 family ATP-binding protein n=1 Tax=Halosquirtibacter xylanolyticus TaxID=3374599 RepID=UPI003748D37E|nr:Mrp/NBP35 family ATP-binding protein [Prolixibacteraceae bacterium]